MSLLKLFRKKKELSDFFVDLSFGKVYFKKLTNKVLNDVFNKSFFGTQAFNINLFYQLFEYELLDLSNKKMDNLFIDDSNLVRTKMKEYLLFYKILQPEVKVEKKSDDADIFHKEDVEWFNNQKSVSLKKYVVGLKNGGK